MNPLNCLIVDDEPCAHDVLKIFIDRVSTLTLAGEAYNTFEAYEQLNATRVDLVFLDINMPEANGFSLLNLLESPPLIIVTTAHPSHAVKSFEYNVVDFLLKPISFDRFLMAIAKAAKWKNALVFENSQHEFLHIKVEGKIIKVPIESIEYIEALGNYVRLTTGRNTLLTYCTIKDIERKLLSYKFVRVHKSFIVNIAAIAKVEEDNIHVSSQKIPIGKTYKQYVTHLLKFKE